MPKNGAKNWGIDSWIADNELKLLNELFTQIHIMGYKEHTAQITLVFAWCLPEITSSNQ